MDRIVRDFLLVSFKKFRPSLNLRRYTYVTASSRSDKTRNHGQVDHREFDRGALARGTEKEDGTSQHDPGSQLQQAGLDAPAHGGAQTTLQSLNRLCVP